MKHLLADAVATFIASHNISPFRETQAPAFLAMLRGHADPLVASVSRFELAFMKARQRGDESCVISWAVEPQGLLNCLARDLPIDDAATVTGAFETVVSGNLASGRLFQVRTADRS
jgi:hypothetical protein